MKAQYLLTIQINDLQTLKGWTWSGDLPKDHDLPKFWPYGRLKGPKIENKTSKNIILSSFRPWTKINMNKSYDPWSARGKAMQSHKSATTPSILTLTSQLLEKLRKKSWEKKSGNLSTRPSFYVKCDIFCGSAEPLYGFPWVCCRKKLAINARVWQKTFQLTTTVF